MTAPVQSSKRRLIAALLAAIVVGGLVVVGLVVIGPGRHDDGPTAAASTAAGSSGSFSSTAPAAVAPGAPATAPTGRAGDAEHPPPSLPVVSLHQPSTEPDGVTAAVVSVQRISGRGTGPGYVSGPALRVSLRVTNGSSRAVDVGSAVVNLYQGKGQAPASPLNDPSRRALAGQLRPGADIEGVYVFSVESPLPTLVTVEVGYRPGAPLMVFSGSPN